MHSQEVSGIEDELLATVGALLIFEVSLEDTMQTLSCKAACSRLCIGFIYMESYNSSYIKCCD